jgi:type II secretory pathway component GspD/PulD (secretin)
MKQIQFYMQVETENGKMPSSYAVETAISSILGTRVMVAPDTNAFKVTVTVEDNETEKDIQKKIADNIKKYYPACWFWDC